MTSQQPTDRGRPLVSVIIPYHNAEATIFATLRAVAETTYPHYEVITVDDGSEEKLYDEIAETTGLHLAMLRQSGAAAARNWGARAASGELLFFVDADVVIRAETIEEIVRTFEENRDIAACFGEYTPEPQPGLDNFPTVYKNLVHHFTHQTAREDARTFWCGCGAIRRESFEKVGGFDESFLAASVEDIDLGYRLTDQGERILLNKKLQVSHGKHYTLFSLIKSDFYDRAIPWSKLMAARNIFEPDLNLKWYNIASALLLIFIPPIIIALGIAYGWHRIWWTPLLVLAGYLALNYKIFIFVMQRRGIAFLVKFALMYTLTYVYSVFGFAVGVFAAIRERMRKRRNE